jgi:hypothetical protein
VLEELCLLDMSWLILGMVCSLLLFSFSALKGLINVLMLIN